MTTIYCSFCGKSQHKVEKLIAGVAIYICNECVSLCVGIIDKETVHFDFGWVYDMHVRKHIPADIIKR